MIYRTPAWHAPEIWQLNFSTVIYRQRRHTQLNRGRCIVLSVTEVEHNTHYSLNTTNRTAHAATVAQTDMTILLPATIHRHIVGCWAALLTSLLHMANYNAGLQTSVTHIIWQASPNLANSRPHKLRLWEMCLGDWSIHRISSSTSRAKYLIYVTFILDIPLW